MRIYDHRNLLIEGCALFEYRGANLSLSLIGRPHELRVFEAVDGKSGDDITERVIVAARHACADDHGVGGSFSPSAEDVRDAMAGIDYLHDHEED